MVTSQFGSILKEFEVFFNCALEPDNHNSCLITLGTGLTIQIEIDRYGFLLIGCRLGVLPMSRYRDNILQEALKSNEASLPSTGTFGFSQKSSQLILFVRVNPDKTHQHLLALMPSFIAKAKQWSEALAAGTTPTDNTTRPQQASGLFGLISKRE